MQPRRFTHAYVVDNRLVIHIGVSFRGYALVLSVKQMEDGALAGYLVYHEPCKDLEAEDQNCKYIDGPCKTDVGFLDGNHLLKVFIKYGEGAVYNVLAKRLIKDDQKRLQQKHNVVTEEEILYAIGELSIKLPDGIGEQEAIELINTMVQSVTIVETIAEGKYTVAGRCCDLKCLLDLGFEQVIDCDEYWPDD